MLLCAVLACVGAGCISLAPQTERPPLPVPETYPADSADATPIDDVPTAVRTAVPRWQAYFSDPRLRALIETALRENRDQHAARARIEAARAVSGIRRSAQWPGVDANAAAIRFRAPGGLLFPQPVIGDLYEVSLVESSWEIDLWGRVSSLKDAALEDYLASVGARRAMALSLVRQVADTYLTVCELDERIALTLKTIETREASLAIFRRRYQVGATSKLDLEQSEILLQQAVALGAQLEQSRATNAHALDLLVGTQALPGAGQQWLDDDGIAPMLTAGLPSDLLDARPDIVAAVHRLRGANANIGAARAAFFPRIALTSSLGSGSTELADLFTSGTRAWTFIPNLTLPIFDAGRNRGNLALAKARRDEALAQYDLAVQSAFRDVSDALAARKWLTEQVRTARETLDAQTERARLVRLRYDDGATRFLEVLDAQRDLLATRRALLASRVALYLAMGGSPDDRFDGSDAVGNGAAPLSLSTTMPTP